MLMTVDTFHDAAVISLHLQHPVDKAERQASGQQATYAAFYSDISQARHYLQSYLEASDLSPIEPASRLGSCLN